MDLIEKDQTVQNDYLFGTPILEGDFSVKDPNLKYDTKTVKSDFINMESELLGIVQKNAKVYDRSNIPDKMVYIKPETKQFLIDEPTRDSKQCENEKMFKHVSHPRFVGANFNSSNILESDIITGISSRNYIRDNNKCNKI